MNPTRIRRLNEEGLRQFHEFLASFSTDSPRALGDMKFLVRNAEITAHVPNVVEVDADKVFARRFDLAAYLHPLIPRLGLPDPTRDVGLWAWLALLWFEQFAPVERKGRKVGEIARWIPEIGSGWRYYRHLVLGPFMVYEAHSADPDPALVLLSESVGISTSEVYREFVESPVLACKPVVRAASTLYLDGESQRLKRGVGVKGAGGSRRLVSVLMQFDRTFDLHTIAPDKLLTMLPGEFDRFKMEVRLGKRTAMVRR